MTSSSETGSTRDILAAASHRPWPLPRVPWVMFQSWRRLLFMHWRVPLSELRPLVPPPLELDEHDGSAWVGITPFLLEGLRARFTPAIPGLSDFPEINVRTYVRAGGRPGIWFFSLDAASGAAVLGARTLYRLPYHRAEMSIGTDDDGWIRYRSRRLEGEATFVGRYRPTGPGRVADPGSLEHFLTERYALYTVLRSGRVLTAEIHHRPWALRPAEADVETNTMAAAAGIQLPQDPPLLHLSDRQDTLIWPPMALP